MKDNEFLYKVELNLDPWSAMPLTGIVLTTDERIERLFGSGRSLYLGEVAGAHSEVEIEVAASDFVRIDESAKIPCHMREAFVVGFDPIHRLIAHLDDNYLPLPVNEILPVKELTAILHEEGYDSVTEEDLIRYLKYLPSTTN